MLIKPPECAPCPLFRIGEGFSMPEGEGTNGVLLVGEALGEHEARSGRPFNKYAQAGSLLERAISRLGRTRDEFTLWNLVACRPPGNKLEGASYEHSAVEHCTTHFRRVLDRARPKAIVALGALPLKYLTRYAGRLRGISDVRGFILDSPALGIPVIPTFHPSFIKRGASQLLPVLIRDLELACEVAEHGYERRTTDYQTYPTQLEAGRFLQWARDHGDVPISYDIETDYSHRESDEAESLVGTGNRITQIQFSVSSGSGIVFQWEDPFISVAKRILALDNPKWNWNGWNFDDLKLRAHGVAVRPPNVDLMWAWHHLQPDLPKRLQFVTSFYDPTMLPWKHTSSSDMQTYGAADVDSLHRIGEKLFSQLAAEGLKESFDEYVVKFYPSVLRMCDRGLPVDREEQTRFRDDITTESTALNERIQRLVPRELRRFSPERGYVRDPESTVGLIRRKFTVSLPKVLKCETCSGTGRVAGKRPRTLKQCPKCKTTGLVASKTEFVATSLERWCRVEPFSPASGPQLLAYMRHRRHPVPVDRLGRPTSDKRELLRLGRKTGDPFYALVVEWRELQKIASTYIDPWILDENGRVHSTIGFGPATGQLSSRSPNIQNIPKHGRLADRFRRCISARPGHTLVELDYTAFHALTLGFEAQDQDYMRLARLDIHSYVAGHLLKLPGRDSWLSLPNKVLRETLADVKKAHKGVRDTKAKPAILGYGFGLGAKHLYDMNDESFSSVREAQALLDLLDSLFPRTAQYRKDIRLEAHRTNKLLSRHNFIRRFFDVLSWDPSRGTWRHGDDSEKVIAFPSANDAFGTVRHVIMECERLGFNEKYRFINTIHDSLLFECPDGLLDECVGEVSAVMEAPSSVLVDSIVAPSGLACGIEVSQGKNWAPRSEDNPEGMHTVYTTPLEVVLPEAV